MILAITIFLSGFVASFIVARKLLNLLARSRYRQFVTGGLDSSAMKPKSKSIQQLFFDFAEKESSKLSQFGAEPLRFGFFGRCKKFVKYRQLAGITEAITERGFAISRIKLSLLMFALAATIGFVISAETSFFLGIVGLIAGFLLPSNWVEQMSKNRAGSLEHHLPEMLDVLEICMRSGLSFDRGLQIYTNSFDTKLAKELNVCHQMWTSGLRSREETLRDLASSYDSIIFSRTIESIIRSLHLGSSLSEGLAAASREARVVYRAKIEEEVAKAPVKMMIPTGTLILPAMLLLVLGPVLLELAGGGL